MPQFGKSDPAENVDELLEFLRAETLVGDLYRGQTKDYPALVPSIYRSLLVDGTQNSPYPLIDDNKRNDPAAQHNQKKWDFARHLHRCFGLGIGNILAQQYGLSSETIDVTGDPRIAAYFASRSYPDYSPMDSSDAPGVIYRIRTSGNDIDVPEIFDGLPLSSLNWYFEGGIHDGALFEDFFLKIKLKVLASLIGGADRENELMLQHVA